MCSLKQARYSTSSEVPTELLIQKVQMKYLLTAYNENIQNIKISLLGHNLRHYARAKHHGIYVVVSIRAPKTNNQKKEEKKDI